LRALAPSISRGSCRGLTSTNVIWISHITFAPNGKTGAEAFIVIRDAMQDEERVALARIVMAHREHMIMLEPLGKGLLGTTLRFDYEVRNEKQYFSEIPSPRISKDMVSLASHILQTKATEFDSEKFEDEYETVLRKLVQRKAGPRRRGPRAGKRSRATSSISWTRCAKA
jgi:DNA end-binding protein Ku